MIKIQNISVRYGEKVILHDLSFEVGRGEVVCLMGESGCGKSSTLNAILGFADYDGSISVCGKGVTPDNIQDVRSSIAYVPQELSLPADTVSEMAFIALNLKRNAPSKPHDIRSAMMAEWTQLGLRSELWDKHVSEISGGQRQRIMLAAASLLGKPLIIVDEPTSALDPNSAHMVGKYFSRLASERGVSVLAVTHSKEFAEYAHRVITIKKHRQS